MSYYYTITDSCHYLIGSGFSSVENTDVALSGSIEYFCDDTTLFLSSIPFKEVRKVTGFSCAFLTKLEVEDLIQEIIDIQGVNLIAES